VDNGARHGWPQIEPLPLADVLAWRNALDIGTQQVAKLPTVKALFSLLHISRMDQTEPTAVLWLAQCLESLFSVPTALSFNYLTSRVPMLLGPPPDEKRFRRVLREFVGARNAFAHGGADVTHPLNHDGLDDPVLNAWERWMAPSDFASSIVIAALQRLVLNGWKSANWREGIEPGA